LMDSSYVLPSPPPHANTAAAIGTTTTCNVNGGRSSGGDDNATSNNNSNNCGSAMPSWGDMSTFAMLPYAMTPTTNIQEEELKFGRADSEGIELAKDAGSVANL